MRDGVGEANNENRMRKREWAEGRGSERVGRQEGDKGYASDRYVSACVSVWVPGLASAERGAWSNLSVGHQEA